MSANAAAVPTGTPMTTGPAQAAVPRTPSHALLGTSSTSAASTISVCASICFTSSTTW